MKHTHILAGAAMLALGSIVSAAQAEELDTFKIDFDPSELETVEGAEDFQRRLHVAARDYCEENYLGTDRRGLRDCEAAVVAAVFEALDEDHQPLLMASSEGR